MASAPPGADRKGWILSTPLLKLQPTASFDPQGPAIILATVTLGAGGAVTSLSGADRQLARLDAGEVVVRRGGPSGAGPEVGNKESGRISPLATGGLQVEVPEASDTVVLQQTGEHNFQELTVRADRLHVGGALEVVRDITVSGTVDGRDVNADGQKLDSHVGITSGNPHGTTAAQIGALLAGDYDLRQRVLRVLAFTHNDREGAERTVPVGFPPRLVLVNGNCFTTFLSQTYSGGISAFAASYSQGRQFEQKCLGFEFLISPERNCIPLRRDGICHAYFSIKSVNPRIAERLEVHITGVVRTERGWGLGVRLRRHVIEGFASLSQFGLYLDLFCMG